MHILKETCCLTALLCAVGCSPKPVITYQIPGVTTFVFHPGGYDTLEFHPEAMKALIEPKCQQKLAVDEVHVYLMSKVPASTPKFKDRGGLCKVDYYPISKKISTISAYIAGATFGTDHQIDQTYWFNHAIMHEILVHACSITQDKAYTRLPDDFNEEQAPSMDEYYQTKYNNQEPVFIFTQNSFQPTSSK